MKYNSYFLYIQFFLKTQNKIEKLIKYYLKNINTSFAKNNKTKK